MILSIKETASLPVKELRAWSLIETSREFLLPSALWRLPDQQVVKFLVSFDKSLESGFSKLEEMPTGFLVSSFANDQLEQAGVIRGDLIFTLSTGGAVLSYEQTPTANTEETNRFLKHAIEISENSIERKYNNTLFPLSDGKDEIEDHYKHIVKKGVEAIQEGKFEKVVLSRTKEFRLSDTFNASKAFLQLEEAYKNAFVSLINLPERGEMWLAATPELLVEVTDKSIFRTIALAGTQSALDERGDLITCDNVMWGHKEIEEQAFVSRYIVSCFKKIRLREYIEKGPKTALAGNLYHLRSDFEVDMKEACFPDLGSVMLALLHPTSAICGAPKVPAMEFILKTEGFDRSFYSGFIGPVNVENSSNFYVNLRSVRFANQIATFFAGAGITEGSDPSKEWKETELKCDTLLRILNTNNS